jgi:DNA-binding GntR family transcriptional regulator
MELDIIEVSSVSSEVYDRLRKRITEGLLPPGKIISIRSIADTFGVSTMPVREALRKLQAEGFVTFERRSVTVNKLSVDEVKQMFIIRQRLELLAAEWAILKVTVDDLDDLREIFQVMKQPDIEVKEWRHRNREFHIRFYECAESPHLIELIRNVWDKVEPYMTIYTSTVEGFQEAHKQHEEILHTIERRDPEGLARHIIHHLEYTSRVVVSALQVH